MLRKLFEKSSEEDRVDADGVPYHHIEGDYRGHHVEINHSEYGYSARKDGDSHTTKANMDKDGLVNWFKSLFG